MPVGIIQKNKDWNSTPTDESSNIYKQPVGIIQKNKDWNPFPFLASSLIFSAGRHHPEEQGLKLEYVYNFLYYQQCR